MSKPTAPGKGLKAMCLEGEAYSLCCPHWCMRRSYDCVQYVHAFTLLYMERPICMHAHAYVYIYIVRYGRKHWWSKYSNLAFKKEI